MRKITKESLEEVAKEMPSANEITSNLFSNNYSTSDSGMMYSKNNPCSYEKYKSLSASGNWTGGYVEGIGFVDEHHNQTTKTETIHPSNGKFVTAADLLEEINKDNKSNVIGNIVEFLSGISIDVTGAILNQINTLFGDSAIASYFKNNPNGQLYRVERKFYSNAGFERTEIKYYDNNKLIATIIK